MTPLIKDTVKMVAEQGLDPVSMHWFDATACLRDQAHEPAQSLKDFRPPFEKCMVCWEGQSKSHQRMRFWMLVAGQDPEEGIVISAWRWPFGFEPVASKPVIYLLDDGQLRYGPLDDSVEMARDEAETILGFMSAWLSSMSVRSEVYVPAVVNTFTNRRKLAAGKVPIYEWRTVVVEPCKPRKDALGGTHASPRQHDRRGHLRRLKSGKNVWVKPCRVGDPTKGVVFHDYLIREHIRSHAPAHDC